MQPPRPVNAPKWSLSAVVRKSGAIGFNRNRHSPQMTVANNRINSLLGSATANATCQHTWHPRHVALANLISHTPTADPHNKRLRPLDDVQQVHKESADH